MILNLVLCWLRSVYYPGLFFFEINMSKFLIDIYSFLPAADLDETESMGPRLQSSFKHIHEVCYFFGLDHISSKHNS